MRGGGVKRLRELKKKLPWERSAIFPKEQRRRGRSLRLYTFSSSRNIRKILAKKESLLKLEQCEQLNTLFWYLHYVVKI